MVSVAATHRRRGVLTVDDAPAAGRRPRLGRAARRPDRLGAGDLRPVRLRHRHPADARARSTPTRVRLSRAARAPTTYGCGYAAPAEVLDACEAVYARLVPARPGMLARQPGWERLRAARPGERAGRRLAAAVRGRRAGRRGRGYARFRVKPDWEPGRAQRHGHAGDLEALDPAAYAALWRFLFDIDLTTTLRARGRPVDEAWQHLVSDVRRCRLRVRDALHVRLVDVGAALEARTYQAPVDVVFEVEDAFCPWNAGRWRLTGDAKGASCVRPTDAADLALSVRELGAAYLGGVSLASLAAAGRVRELRQGALAEASVAFSSDVAPVAAARVLEPRASIRRSTAGAGRPGTRRGCGRRDRRCGSRRHRCGRAGSALR